MGEEIKELVNSFYIPPIEEAEAALEDAQRVKEFVISKIK